MDNVENKPLLVEYLSRNQSKMQSDIVESIGKDGEKLKHWYLKGIFIMSEEKNLNERIYPRDEIENAVNNLNEEIKEHGHVLGELDHPETLTINLQNVSHAITEMHMEGNNGVGTMKILSNTPSGKIAEGLLADGISLGVSSRGIGEVDEYTHRVSGFEIVTIDIVATPSAKDARPMAIYEQLMRSGKGQKLYNNTQDLLMNKNSVLEQAWNQDMVAWIKSWNYK